MKEDGPQSLKPVESDNSDLTIKGRKWLPFWFKIDISEGGRSKIKLWIPLFIIIPMLLLIITIALPFLIIGGIIYKQRSGKQIPKFTRLIFPVYYALATVMFYSRGTSIEVHDGDDHVNLRLE